MVYQRAASSPTILPAGSRELVRAACWQRGVSSIQWLCQKCGLFHKTVEKKLPEFQQAGPVVVVAVVVVVVAAAVGDIPSTRGWST